MHNIIGCTGKWIPGGCEDGNELDIICCKTAEEFDGKNFAEICTSQDDSCKCKIGFSLRKKIWANDETGIGDGEIFETSILVDNWTNNGEIDVCSGKLSGVPWVWVPEFEEYDLLPVQSTILYGSQREMRTADMEWQTTHLLYSEMRTSENWHEVEDNHLRWPLFW